MMAGCGKQTGIELSVSASTSPTSIESGVVSLEFVTSHASFCERWVQDQTASGTVVDVNGRDLSKSPYRLLVLPSHMTDLSQPVFSLALARDANGRVIGVAAFGEHPYKKGAIDEYQAELQMFRRTDASYVSSDGCVCVPGLPWIGTDPARDCDANVVTSFARLIDTAGCELAPGRRDLTAPVCDGQIYDVTDEVRDRALPCFANGEQGCVIGVRTCADHDGVAYTDECVPDSKDPALPGTALCDAYAGCEQQACGDLIGCFLQAVPPAFTINCTMRVDPNPPDGKTIKPCGTGTWEAALPTNGPTPTGSACVASVIDGTRQRTFTFGFKSEDPNTMGAQVRSTLCPPTLHFDSVGAPSPAEVPDTLDFTVSIGNQLAAVHTTVLKACIDGPSLLCHL
jgi:hypothetical protein